MDSTRKRENKRKRKGRAERKCIKKGALKGQKAGRKVFPAKFCKITDSFMSKAHGWCLKKKKNILAELPSECHITIPFLS